MSLPVVVRPEARLDLLEAWGWYEDKRPGLGDELIACVDAALGSAARGPTLHARVHNDVRRVLVPRFPYAVFYTIEPDHLAILAIGHVRREPAYWLHRTR